MARPLFITPQTHSSARSAPRRLAARAAPLALLALLALLVGACAAPPAPADAGARGPAQAQLPLLRGWFEGQPVFYVTTDVSDPHVAQLKGANLAPRLADALPGPAARAAGQRSAVDKVYDFTNFEQGTVFASAPSPIGHLSQSRAYSPLWQQVKVAWRQPAAARTLKSEEEILEAAERGALTLEETRVVLNCPIIQRSTGAGLPGVSINRAIR